MYTIAKRFTFSASHIIGGLPPDHRCGRLHGHNYEVEVVLQSATLDAAGFVRDYGELSAVKDFLDATLDHRHLNHVLGHDRTTAEVIGKWLYDWCKARWPEVVAERRVLCLKSAFRLERRGEQDQAEAEQRDHPR